MKTFAIVLAALCLAQFASSQSCSTGYYLASGATRCSRCDEVFTSCTDASTGSIVTSIVGYTVVSGNASPYCPLGNGYYNKNTNTCDFLCKLGCATCRVDYDFCTECTNGFTWNTDHTCLPAVIGLEAASLALLAISLIFLIISCCLVNKAKKWTHQYFDCSESYLFKLSSSS